MFDIVIATRNPHKVRELTGLLKVAGIRWRSLREFPSVRPVKETGRTFDANARQKARAAARATGCWAMADDSGLEVEALRWGPGVRSARFAGAHGNDRANNEKLLRRLRGVPREKRRARYRCTLALASPRGAVTLARGAWSGRIAMVPAGRRGFGYDPVFLVPRLGKTVAQLPASTKHRLSHRAAAARGLRPMLLRLIAERRRRGSGGNRPGRARST
jgi:XTP/dITP diphosphohydrolase